VKHIIIAAALAGPVIFGAAALAQNVPTNAPSTTPVPPERPRPTEPPSNAEMHVAIDHYIGDPRNKPGHIGYDVMLNQPILTADDKSGDPGAVLLYRKFIDLDTLLPGETGSLQSFDEQMVFYVESGEGRLDDSKSAWPLKRGTIVLVPSHISHRFKTIGDAPLKMISVSTPVDPGVVPKTAIIVRDVDKMVMTERNVHWNNFSKYVFLGAQDGLHPSDRVYLVYMSPMTIAGAHAHSPGQEEIWIKVTDGEALMQIGSEIRKWPINVGMMAPPNGQTVHAAYNLSDTRQAWLYVARLNPGPVVPRPPQPPRPANPNRPPPNPAIAEGLANSNVAPVPLEQFDRRQGK